MTCLISSHLLAALEAASEYGTPERTLEDAKRECNAIRPILVAQGGLLFHDLRRSGVRVMVQEARIRPAFRVSLWLAPLISLWCG
jgi:hypothetical protein